LGDGKDFTARPRWQRFVVYLAGPAMNAVLTVAVMTALYMIGFGEPASLYDEPVIGAVAAGSPAEAAGLRPGDLILAIDGKPQPNWQTALYSVALRPSVPLRVRVRRAGAEMEVVMTSGVTPDKVGTIGVGPLVHIQEVTPDTPAQRAGLQLNDAILKVGDQTIVEVDNVSPAVHRRSPDRTQIYREGWRSVTPARVDGVFRRVKVGADPDPKYDRCGGRRAGAGRTQQIGESWSSAHRASPTVASPSSPRGGKPIRGRRMPSSSPSSA
jgi:regulator of sigma E protease